MISRNMNFQFIDFLFQADFPVLKNISNNNLH